MKITSCPFCQTEIVIPEVPVRRTKYLRCYKCGKLFPYKNDRKPYDVKGSFSLKEIAMWQRSNKGRIVIWEPVCSKCIQYIESGTLHPLENIKYQKYQCKYCKEIFWNLDKSSNLC